MTIRELKYVIQIAQCKSLSIAAQSLYVSQSTLSVAIKNLEEELGIKLFFRTNTGISLTHEGMDFLPHARKLVEDSEALLLRYKDKPDKQTLFDISSQNFPFATRAFSRILNSITQSDYTITIREETKNTIIDHVKNETSELGVIAFSDSKLPDALKILSAEGLQFYEVRKLPVVAFLRGEHPLADQPFLTAELLKDYPYVTYIQSDVDKELQDEYFSDRIPTRIVYVNERSSAIALIRRSNSYTVCADLPNSRIATVGKNGVEIVAVPFIADCASIVVGYITKSNHNLSVIAREYIAYLTEEIDAVREQERYKNQKIKLNQS